MAKLKMPEIHITKELVIKAVVGVAGVITTVNSLVSTNKKEREFEVMKSDLDLLKSKMGES